MEFKKAQRSQSRLRLALMGTSGSGKTYGALQIARGIGGRIAVIDTERGSAALYADQCEYDVCSLDAPYSAQRYIEAIHAAEAAGYNTIIIDSLSHAWQGDGGLLDQHDMAAKSSRSGNSFQAWREITPLHNRLVDAMLQSPAHIIACMRSKTEYALQTDERGKQKPVKIGLAPVFRDGIEYEFTCCLDISVDGHVATATKDRTGLFDNYHIISVDTGKRLSAWLNGAQPQPQAQPQAQAQADINALLSAIHAATTPDQLQLACDAVGAVWDTIPATAQQALHIARGAKQLEVTKIINIGSAEDAELPFN